MKTNICIIMLVLFFIAFPCEYIPSFEEELSNSSYVFSGKIINKETTNVSYTCYKVAIKDKWKGVFEKDTINIFNRGNGCCPRAYEINKSYVFIASDQGFISIGSSCWSSEYSESPYIDQTFRAFKNYYLSI